MSKMVVIFEVTPFDDASKEEYLRLSASLRPLLVDHGGFLGGERFQSLSDPRKLLSINFWDSEEELEKWRNRVEHRMAQLAGRERLFDSYRITVAAVAREYSMDDRAQAPEDSNRHFHVGK